uniref:uncharacterized protein n=1 Tax=Centroberyx gerrardi TaxID=166262 RepID=UPI003AABF953
MFRLYLLLVPLLRAYGAKSQSLLYANLGDNVTLPCLHPSSDTYLSWYKQAAGEKPQLISYYYTHSSKSNVFKPPFKDNLRFSVETEAGLYDLNILNVQPSDSAMYYCGRTSITVIEFDNGTFLVIKESSRRSFLQQPVSESVRPGDSVTLNCTVHNGTSDGEHSVYWFRHDSEDSHLGIMYTHTHRGRNGQCDKSFESPAQSCVYSLPRRNVSLSDAGTYYCAVASCGEMLLGDGTRLDVRGQQSGHLDALPVLIYCLVAALIVSFIGIVILACILYKMTRRSCLQCRGLQPQPSAPESTADLQYEDSGALQYVALDFKKKAKARRQKSTEEETVYSGLRQSDRD